MTQKALAGVKVVDLSDERAIYGAKLLADMGADVVRPESTEGDPLRSRGPFHKETQTSLYHAFFASSRTSVALNLAQHAHQTVLLDLVQSCDILLVCDGCFGSSLLDVSLLQAQYPDVVVINVSSFGNEGPWQTFLAPDLVAGALGGAVATTGDADTAPLKAYGELNFIVSGTYVAIAALSALYARNRDGVGECVDVSVHECLASCLEQVLMFYWYCDVLQRPGQKVLPRRGSLHWSDAYAVMNGANGSIMVTPTPDFDQQLAWLIEEDAHADLIDPKYMEPENLRLRIERTMEILRDWVAQKDVQALFMQAQERHIPYGWVQRLADIGDNPQLKAREWFVETPVGETFVKGTGAPYHFSKTPWHLEPPRECDAASILQDLEWQTRNPIDPEEQRGSMSGESSRPLAGLRVLDFTHVLAGPYATRILADMGADVVKVNSAARAAASNTPEHPYYTMWNRNKRALSLNMADDAAREVCRSLCDEADIVIDNFSVGVLDRWGVGYSTVAQSNPGVIYIQMSGMGEGGPWSKFVTYAPTIHALAGLTAMNGVPGREDIGLGFSYNDHIAGLHGAFAILAALQARNLDGSGQRIEVSQFEVGVNLTGPSILNLFANGVSASAVGNRLPYDQHAPHNVYQCAPIDVSCTEDERWIALSVTSETQWEALCKLMGNPDWCQEARFATAEERYTHSDALDERLSEWTADWNDYELMQACQSVGVPAGVVQNGADLMERDPQLHQGAGRREFTRKLDDVHPDLGQTWVDKLPLQFTRQPCESYNRVKALGEDNLDVLSDWLSMDARQVEQLTNSGALT